MPRTKASIAERISEIRDRIIGLSNERADMERVPRTREEITEALDRWIDREASQWEPAGIRGLVQSASISSLELVGPNRAGNRNWQAAMCALAPETIRARLLEAAETHLAAHETTITAEQAANRIAELDTEILDLERQEEALIAESESAGTPVHRRGDADPRAVLDLAKPPARPTRDDDQDTERVEDISHLNRAPPGSRIPT